MSSFNFDENNLRSKVGEIIVTSPDKNNFSRSMKITKRKDQHINHVNVLITKCNKKPNSNTENSNSGINTLSKNVSELTNTEDIKDFYAYTKECLRRFSKIIPPTNEELEKLYIKSFPFDEELKSKLE